MADEEKKDIVVEEKVEEIDWEAKYNETQANLDKVAAERENYKKVALSKKGHSDDETDEERIERIVNEKLQNSTEANLLKQKDELARAAMKKVNELTVALKNRSQIGASAGQGGGQSNTDVKTEFWTVDQLAYFKKRGIDPEKAKDNYLKLKNN